MFWVFSEKFGKHKRGQNHATIQNARAKPTCDPVPATASYNTAIW